MLNLKSYVWNVCQIFLNNPEAETQEEAFNMLRQNIEQGEEVHRGTSLPYQFLRELWEEMDEEMRKQSIDEYYMCAEWEGHLEPVIKGDRFRFDQRRREVFARARTEMLMRGDTPW